MKFENLCLQFCRTHNSASIDTSINCIGSTVRFVAGDPLFLRFFVNNSFSMKKMEKKVHDGYPILFLILHMCANFHQNRTYNKDFFWAYTPLSLPVGFTINRETRLKYNPRTAKFSIHIKGSCSIIPASFGETLSEIDFLRKKKRILRFFTFSLHFQSRLHQIHFPPNLKL